MNITKFRDLTILAFTSEKKLVIACDSSAAIGEKEHDQVAISAETVAAYCLRVPLLELLCFGAQPLCVVDLIGNEYAPTGRRMLQGIRDELDKAGLAELPVNGSTEENMTTTTSSIGVTLIGEVATDHPLPKIVSDAVLLQLGTPYVGNEVTENLAGIFSYDVVVKLREEAGVRDMLPVGSQGIRYEAENMAGNSGLQVTFDTTEELEKSAGPATVVLIAADACQAEVLVQKYSLKKIGRFHIK